MAVFYKLRQDNSSNPKRKGKWYGRSVMQGTTDTNQLAEIMQRNCTLKKSDIVAVITELVETMQEHLQNSKRVKLNGFGTFKIGLRTSPASEAKDFTVSKNVKGLHVLFQPETRIDSNKKRIKTFLTGAKVQEMPKDNIVTGNENNGDDEHVVNP